MYLDFLVKYPMYKEKSNIEENVVNGLQKLLDKRDAQKKDELWKAIVHSDKSYDEIPQYIKTENKEDE